MIYIPTPRGVEAQTVYVGPHLEIDDQVDSVEAADKVRFDLVDIAVDSSILRIMEHKTALLFISNQTLVADIGSGTGTDYLSADAACLLFSAHVDELIDIGRVDFCREYKLDSIALDPRSEAPVPLQNVRSISYTFSAFDSGCGPHSSLDCITPPFSQGAILKMPICVVADVFHFRTRDGIEFHLIAGSDRGTYGVSVPVNVFSHPDLSIGALGTDYSNISSLSECKKIIRSLDND